MPALVDTRPSRLPRLPRLSRLSGGSRPSIRWRARAVALGVVGAAAAYGLVVPSGAHPVGWEASVAGWLRVAPGSHADAVARLVVELGTQRVVAGVAGGLAAGLAASGRVRVAIFGFVAVLLAAGGGELAKGVIDRRIGAGAALAYPSGHTAGATALAMTILLVVAPEVGGRRIRLLGAAAVVGVGATVGLAMVAEGWHYPADVIGGLGFGIAVPILVLGGFARDAAPRAVAAVDVGSAAAVPAPVVAVARPAVPAAQRFGVRDAPVPDEVAAEVVAEVSAEADVNAADERAATRSAEHA